MTEFQAIKWYEPVKLTRSKGVTTLDVGILGWRFTAIRLACTFFFPPIAGWIAQGLFGSMK